MTKNYSRFAIVGLALTILSACEPVPTETRLDNFWDQYGDRTSFEPMFVDALETTLNAEDDIKQGDYAAASSRVKAIFDKYPAYSSQWTKINRFAETLNPAPHIGDAGPYAALRMLDEIIGQAAVNPPQTVDTLIMTAVVSPCSNIIVRGGTFLNRPMDPEITKNNYQVLRESVHLFQQYIRAISGGVLDLKLDIVTLDSCFDIKASTGLVTGNYHAPIRKLSAEVRARTDMYWVVYQNETGVDIGQTGGMGGFEHAPVFIGEAGWWIFKPASQGGGIRTTAERRAYLPQWFQHEYFHYLYRSWPELRLEETDHDWFYSAWPDDFVEGFESDYYAQSLHQRLYNATPSIAEMIRESPHFLVRSYQRVPVENPWHEVNITLVDGNLYWNNAAGQRWSLTWNAGRLSTDASSPYGAASLRVLPDGSLLFNGEVYQRKK